MQCTVCPRSFDPFYIVSYYKKKSRLLSSWTYLGLSSSLDKIKQFFFNYRLFKKSCPISIVYTHYKSDKTF